MQENKEYFVTSRLVVLISGNGSNLQAILDACASGQLRAQVVSVISNKAEAPGLVRASKAGVQAIYFPRGEKESRQDYDTRLAACVFACSPDFVILAGWMRILSFAFLSSFPQRVINLHPALPGMFPGTHAIGRAHAAYQRGEIDRTGVMVHLVPDEGVDIGPVLGLQEIHFMPDESLERFEARVHEVEHKLLIETLKKILDENERSL
jgi:formyltetrahydrofolate-dependent phosphoribosylglycinamide formyltransferase